MAAMVSWCRPSTDEPDAVVDVDWDNEESGSARMDRVILARGLQHGAGGAAAASKDTGTDLLSRPLSSRVAPHTCMFGIRVALINAPYGFFADRCVRYLPSTPNCLLMNHCCAMDKMLFVSQ